MRVFFDTNILVHLSDAEDVVKKELACARFEAEASAGRVLLTTRCFRNSTCP